MTGASIVAIFYAATYAFGVVRFDRRFPQRPFSRASIAWQVFALATLWVAIGALDAFADGSFAAHMVQHVLLIGVVAPALVLAAPARLLLGVLPQTRARRIALALRSRLFRALTSPGISWLALPAVLWASHYSGVFELALEHPIVHIEEHAAYLGAAVLFWSQVFPVAPLPARLGPAARVLYVFSAGPANAFLGLALWSSRTVMYAHYATHANAFGWPALDDLRAGGAVMWIGSSVETLVAMLAVIALWGASERKRDRRLPLVAAGIALAACALASTGAARAADRTFDEGHTQYTIHCSSCHAVDLRGGADAPSIRGIGAAAVDWWVGSGRMPAAEPGPQALRKPASLDPAQIAALVTYVTQTAPGGPPIPDVRLGGDLQHGRALFVENCEHCHGAYGTGATLGSRSVAPSLAYPSVVQIGEAMRIGPGLMPKFGPHQFSDRDVNDVASYVVWLRRSAQSPGGIELGAGGPVGEGAVAWIVVGIAVTGYSWFLGTSIARKDEAKEPEPVD